MRPKANQPATFLSSVYKLNSLTFIRKKIVHGLNETVHDYVPGCRPFLTLPVRLPVCSIEPIGRVLRDSTISLRNSNESLAKFVSHVIT